MAAALLGWAVSGLAWVWVSVICSEELVFGTVVVVVGGAADVVVVGAAVVAPALLMDGDRLGMDCFGPPSVALSPAPAVTP